METVSYHIDAQIGDGPPCHGSEAGLHESAEPNEWHTDDKTRRKSRRWGRSTTNRQSLAPFKGHSDRIVAVPMRPS